MIKSTVKGKHADAGTKIHCLYGYFYQGISLTKLATIYGKAESTIYRWVQRYKDGKGVERLNATPKKIFNSEKRAWVIDFYDQKPTAYLKECQHSFSLKFNQSISVSTIWNILNENGYTYKVLERRALKIKMSDVVRFAQEMNSIHWCGTIQDNT